MSSNRRTRTQPAATAPPMVSPVAPPEEPPVAEPIPAEPPVAEPIPAEPPVAEPIPAEPTPAEDLGVADVGALARLDDRELDDYAELEQVALADLAMYVAGRYVAPQRLQLAKERHLRAVRAAGERVEVDWYTQRVLFPTLGLG